MRRRFSLALIFSISTSSGLTGQIAPPSKDSKALRDGNSSLFWAYATSATIEESLPADFANRNGKTYFVVRKPFTTAHEATGDTTRMAYLRSAAVNSDLIIVGEPTERNSDFTNGHKFIFSNYVIAVDKVLFSKTPLVIAGQSIVVTRPGGQISIGTNRVFGSVPGFQLFKLNEPYLLFLRKLPNGTFIVFGEAAYDMSGSTVRVHPHGRDIEQEVDKKSFDADMMAILNELSKGDR